MSQTHFIFVTFVAHRTNSAAQANSTASDRESEIATAIVKLNKERDNAQDIIDEAKHQRRRIVGRIRALEAERETLRGGKAV